MKIELEVPKNEDGEIRTNKVQEAIDLLFKFWRDRDDEHMIFESCGLSKDEARAMHDALKNAGWALFYVNPQYNDSVHIAKRMPQYGIPVR